MNIRVARVTGNILIAISIFGMIAIYLPIIQAYFYPPPQTLPPDTHFSIHIPKISATAPVIAGVNPWVKAEYLEALSRGVAQAQGTSLPDIQGTMYLFAHSSDAPWRLTRYNTIFLRLGNLTSGDEIEITKDGTSYIYKVTGKKEVWPSEVDTLVNAQTDSGGSDSGTHNLVLQTCAPLGTDLKRLLVFAEQD
jgi:LPXTG-site transpeptidase (sortase) family protein